MQARGANGGRLQQTGSPGTDEQHPEAPTRSGPEEDVGGRRHVPSLDGIRGLAILLVMVFHQTLLSKVKAQLPAVDVGFEKLAGVGWCGVDLFFVLSGFLITGILIDAKGRPHYFRNFYARRTLRIFPLYYAVVFLSLVVIPNLSMLPVAKAESLGRIEGDEIWYWLYLSNYSIAAAGQWRHGILDISWSLAIEEQFYLLWPTLVWFTSLERLRTVCVAFFVGALAVRVGLFAGGADPMSAYVLTPARMDGLAAGAWLATAARSPGGLAAIAAPVRRMLFASGALLVLLFAWRGGLDAFDAPVATAGFSLLALFFGALLATTLTSPPGSALRAFFESRPMRVLGTYSYALYLFHLPLRALLRDTLYGPADFTTWMGSYLPGQLLFYVLSSLLALAAAWVSWHGFEKHFLALKRYFPSAPTFARKSEASPETR